MRTEPKNILLIGDDEVHAQQIQDILAERNASFQVEWVKKLQKAIKLLSSKNIDLILLDLESAESKGLESFVKIHTKAPKVPVVALADKKGEKLAKEGRSKGLQDYLIKGQVESHLLFRTINHALENQKMQMKLERIVKDLKASENRFLDIITQNADGILIVDQNGIVRFVNSSAEVILGRKAEELVGGLLGFPLVLEKPTEISFIRKDGVTATSEMRVIKTVWENRSAFLTLLRDISDRKRMLSELELAHQDQKKIKDQFLSHVSHGLSAPIDTINESVSRLLEEINGDLTPMRCELLDTIQNNVHDLSKMIDDLIEVTRATSEKLTIEPHSISVAEIIDETIKTFQRRARVRKVVLSSEVPDDLPSVYADPIRIKQILSNLIDNAIKFTPEKGKVSVRSSVFLKDHNFVGIEVMDTGRGINPSEKNRIFDYLYQAENSLDQNQRGLGLGLYISKELVSRHGGQIWVKSQSDKGSSFFFTIPAFSLTNLLIPILTPENLKKASLALISTEIPLPDKSNSSQIWKKMIQEIQGVLQSCTLPDTDVLLPRMTSPKSGTIFFLVVCADQKGVEVIVRRIRRQLKRLGNLQKARISPKISSKAIDISKRKYTDKKSLNPLIKKIKDTVEEIVKSKFYKNETDRSKKTKQGS